MVDYSNVIQVGVGLLLIILLGFVLRKTNVIKNDDIPPINKYVFRVCFICLLARSSATKDITQMNMVPFGIGAVANATIQIIFLITFLLPLEDKGAYYLGSVLPMTFVNTIVIGVPIFNVIWTPEENIIIPIYSLSNDLFTTPTYLIYTSLYHLHRRNVIHKHCGEPVEKFNFSVILGILKRIITNPIIIGNIIGFSYAATRWQLPLFFERLINWIADAVLPYSLFTCGCFIAEKSFFGCPWPQFIITMMGRHILAPLITAVYSWAFGLSNRECRQTIALSTFCTGTTAYLLSSESSIQPGVSSTMVFWTTIVMIPALILWFWILDALGIFVE